MNPKGFRLKFHKNKFSFSKLILIHFGQRSIIHLDLKADAKSKYIIKIKTK